MTTSQKTPAEKLMLGLALTGWVSFVVAILLGATPPLTAGIAVGAALVLFSAWFQHDFETTSIPRPFDRLPREVREQLQYARSIGKRLDEHREVVEAIASKTTLFEVCRWHANHMATQDDFLMRLYHMVYGCWPEDAPALYGDTRRQATGEYVRPRPAILGKCALPEYRKLEGS